MGHGMEKDCAYLSGLALSGSDRETACYLFDSGVAIPATEAEKEVF